MTAKQYDWEAVEADYRAGTLSVVTILDKYGMPRATLTSRARREGWQRDLSKQVRKAVAAKVAVKAVQEAVGKTDAQIIEEAASHGADLVTRHQQQASQWQNIVDALASTLKQQLATGKIEVTGKDGSAQLIDVPLDYVSKTLAQGVTALEKLIKLERQAHNLDETERSGRSLDELLDDVADD